MGKSLLLAVFVFVLALICTWGIRHFGAKHGESSAKLNRLTVLFVVGGLLFAGLAFWLDFGQRQVTLFEALLPGSAETSVPVVRTADFVFEHAGVEHTLVILPKPAFAENATQPVVAQIVLRLEDGETLLKERVSFGLENVYSKHGAPRPVWESRSWRFSPQRAGKATLQVTLETPGVHEVLVRVEDPEKRDGKRAEGY